ncbi:MAG TPA: DUF3943 domain-containing protein [Polyangiaceae bacterium]|nr:DUF3943 domain-containing protein [Polyangiaceae bacterium]
MRGRLTVRLLGAASLLSMLAHAALGRAQVADAQRSAEPEWSPAEEEVRAPHHARSFLEMGAGLALGATGYWILMDRNVADWDNPSPEDRFRGEAWIFDNNSLAVNFLGHPLTGGLSYSFARANHQGVAGSFAYSFVTSFLWEFVLEYKEKISVNDTIATPGAGLPIGEFFYKLGLYLDSGDGRSTSVDVARWLLGTGVALDRSLDGRATPRVITRDRLGFSRQIWHDFALRYGVSLNDTPSEAEYARYRVGLAARLVTLPGYLKPRSLVRGFHRAEISDFSVSSEASRHGAGLLVGADTILAGIHLQDMQQAGRKVTGAALSAGSSMGFAFLRSSANRYRSVERAVAAPDPPLSYHTPHSREQFSGFHLPGLALEARVQQRWGSLQLGGRLQPSFGGLGAPAFYDWAAANLDEKGKHILHRQGYFYGWGPAMSAKAALALGPLRAHFDVSYARYDSQEGYDRHIERITVDVPAEGDFLAYEGSVGVSPAGAPLSVSLDVGVRRFRSKVESFERTARVVERGLSATWAF